MRITSTICCILSLLFTGCRDDNTVRERPAQLSNAAQLGAKATQSTKRIVSLTPSITEMLFELGAGERVVGVTRYCNYPPEAQQLPKIGGYIDPSFEAIVALKPDLVIGTTNPGNKSKVEALQQHGIRVLWLSIQTYDDVRESFGVIAKALGIPEQGQEKLVIFDTAIKNHRSKIPDKRTPPKVLIILGHRPIIVAGKGSFTGDLIALAGGENIANDSKIPYPQWTAETLLRAKPDVIIDAWMSDESEAPADRWRTMTAIPAVKRGHVHKWNDERILRPGPRLPGALGALIEVLHLKGETSAR